MVAQVTELVHGSEVVSLGDSDALEERDLLLLDGVVLSSKMVELTNEHIDLIAVVTDLGEAVVFEVLLVNLSFLDALLEVADLLSQLQDIALSVAQLVDLGLQFRHKVVLVARHLLDDGDLLMPRRALLNVGSRGNTLRNGITGGHHVVARLVHGELSTDLASVSDGRS